MPLWKPYNDWMTVIEDGQAILCGVCKYISWNPNDVKEGYCGKCHNYYHIRTKPGFVLEECARCGTILQNNVTEHECKSWTPYPNKIRVEFSECTNCKVIFEDDGHDMCTACRNPVNRRMALLFENDYDEKNLLVNECRRCGATWSSYVSDYLCTLCSKQDRISIGEKL